ncbi:MAG: hypothetical protein ABS955_01925 [Stenotrophomonas maltophilia]
MITGPGDAQLQLNVRKNPHGKQLVHGCYPQLDLPRAVSASAT